MPRIAIIADIHANLFALEAVVDDIAAQNVDEVLVAGDLVGRGPQGSAVVHRIAELGWRCVRGNHEDYLLNFIAGDIPDDWRRLDQWAASRWMARELDEESVQFIDQLPFSLHADTDPGVEVFHGSPNSHSEGIGKWTPEPRLEQLLDDIDGSVLVCAHTHRPLQYHSDQGLVVNVGSVGLPFNSDWRAQYVILQRRDDGYEVTLRRVEYPRHKILDYYETSGFLDDGGVTAQLLYHELNHARPFLVPFLKWAEKTDRPADPDSLPEFLDVYDPSQSMRTFFEQLGRGTSRPTT